MSTPWNPGVVIVPQQMAWVVERFGRFDKVLEPGLRFLLPWVHRVSYTFSLKEEAISVPSQTAITKDNVSISIDAVLYVKVIDAYKAAYGVEDPHFAVTQLAQTTMRSEIGKLSLDKMFEERENLNAHIVAAINSASADWGISCMRYEIRDITPPRAVKAAMEMQAEAERRKRALILDSEGEREAEVNIANGKKLARVLASEAEMQERANIGKGEAMALELHAVASANATKRVAEALLSSGGQASASLRLAEQYVLAFKALAKEGNCVVVPANAGDVSSMVAQATGIYKSMMAQQPAQRGAEGTGTPSGELDGYEPGSLPFDDAGSSDGSAFGGKYAAPLEPADLTAPVEAARASAPPGKLQPQ